MSSRGRALSGTFFIPGTDEVSWSRGVYLLSRAISKHWDAFLAVCRDHRAFPLHLVWDDAFYKLSKAILGAWGPGQCAKSCIVVE